MYGGGFRVYGMGTGCRVYGLGFRCIKGWGVGFRCMEGGGLPTRRLTLTKSESVGERGGGRGR